jgi:hypothetical protein
MAEEFLHHAKVCPAIEEVRRKRVAQRVGVDLASKICGNGGTANGRPSRLPA